MFKASAVVVLACFAASALPAQEAISQACAKAGVNAIEAIKSNPQSAAAKTAFDAAKSSCYHGKITDPDYAALLQVTLVKMVKEHGTLQPSCVNPIEEAFRKGVKLDETPESCVTGGKDSSRLYRSIDRSDGQSR